MYNIHKFKKTIMTTTTPDFQRKGRTVFFSILIFSVLLCMFAVTKSDPRWLGCSIGILFMAFSWAIDFRRHFDSWKMAYGNWGSFAAILFMLFVHSMVGIGQVVALGIYKVSNFIDFIFVIIAFIAGFYISVKISNLATKHGHKTL